MLKRLIEVALPLKEVSEHSAREKSIRHGHISTLHIWWARRPLAACRAAVFAALIPDPDDPECPEEFRKLVMDVLGKRQFQPTNGDGSSIEDTPRNRCLEFIKHLVRWENSNSPDYIEPASKLIVAAHKFLHLDAEGDAPRVLDPFAGGGSIPLEALRLGCEAHAVDLNPVAHLIELCTLVYPQKYGQPDSRPVPDYIEQLIAHNRAKRKEGEADLFGKNEAAISNDHEIIPDVDITEAEYRKNPLVADVKYWGHWVLERSRREIAHLYPATEDGQLPVAYLWARAVPCHNPTCGANVPLIQQRWIAKKSNRKVAVDIVHQHGETIFQLCEGKDIHFDPDLGTLSRTAASCPFCHTTIPKKDLQSRSIPREFKVLPILSVWQAKGSGKIYQVGTLSDVQALQAAEEHLKQFGASRLGGLSPRPDEPLPYLRSIFNCHVYGLQTWGSLSNPRQVAALATFCAWTRTCCDLVHQQSGDKAYAQAVGAYLGLLVDEIVRFTSTLNRWKVDAEAIVDLFGRQALAMVWDYCENVPIGTHGGTWSFRLTKVLEVLRNLTPIGNHASVYRGSATRLPYSASTFSIVLTDPPYYDAVPYADLSDYFYVWEKRSIAHILPENYRTPLTPKHEEAVQLAERNPKYASKTKEFFESQIRLACEEARRVLHDNGVINIMFSHKTTSAWETLVSGLIVAGLTITASWPLHTEQASRMRAHNSATLASSILLVCRKRPESSGDGLWDEVRQELRKVAYERLDFFWNRGIRGADFFISAIGPALSVFAEYDRVTMLSGDDVTVGQFLDEVRALVTNYALEKILHTTHTAAIDPASRFYVVWQWSYGDAKVPADESFKLSQALGMHTEEMWDRTGVLEKAGENVQAVPIAKRIRVKNLGEPTADGTPASLIDVLHRLCAFREKGDTQGMVQFLGQSGHANNPTLWLVAQAISEILPDGDKEKQLMQGLLNQREGLAEATRQRALF